MNGLDVAVSERTLSWSEDGRFQTRPIQHPYVHTTTLEELAIHLETLKYFEQDHVAILTVGAHGVVQAGFGLLTSILKPACTALPLLRLLQTVGLPQGGVKVAPQENDQRPVLQTHRKAHLDS